MFRKLGWIFGGLQPAYFLRHFILISPLPLIILTHMPLTDMATHTTINWGQVEGFALVTLSWFLYPFSRFVYESVVNWIMGGEYFYYQCSLMVDYEAVNDEFLFYVCCFLSSNCLDLHLLVL